VNRKAAPICGRSAAERNAIVIDRFFDAKQHALAWAEANPHFTTVQIRTPDTETTYSPLSANDMLLAFPFIHRFANAQKKGALVFARAHFVNVHLRWSV